MKEYLIWDKIIKYLIHPDTVNNIRDVTVIIGFEIVSAEVLQTQTKD